MRSYLLIRHRKVLFMLCIFIIISIAYQGSGLQPAGYSALSIAEKIADKLSSVSLKSYSLEVEPKSIELEAVPNSIAKTSLTFHNKGTLPLNIEVSSKGKISTAKTEPFQLPPNSSKSQEITFSAPEETGNFTAALSIDSEARRIAVPVLLKVLPPTSSESGGGGGGNSQEPRDNFEKEPLQISLPSEIRFENSNTTKINLTITTENPLNNISITTNISGLAIKPAAVEIVPFGTKAIPIELVSNSSNCTISSGKISIQASGHSASAKIKVYSGGSTLVGAAYFNRRLLQHNF